MTSIGLCIITKDWSNQLATEIDRLLPYFDQVYIQVNGRGRVPHNYDKVEFSTYKWNDNFADARNALLKEVKTDYWMWIDTDDRIEGLDNLRKVVAQMEATDVTQVMCMYKYTTNQRGEYIADHWRERIMKTGAGFKWVGRVHEGCYSEDANWVRIDDIAVWHEATADDLQKSFERNLKLLEADWKETQDPRTASYLGRMYFAKAKDQQRPEFYPRAVKMLVKHIQTSGWDEDKYRSWVKLAECYNLMGDQLRAIDACLEALKLQPDWPDAYFALGMFFYELDQPEKSLEWVAMGMAKPDPDTIAMYDPTIRYRATMFAALSAMILGKVDDAWRMVNLVKKQSPTYPIMLKYLPLIEEAKLEKEAVEKARWLMKFVAARKDGKPELIFGALGNFGMDVRFNPERYKLYPPKKWPQKSIVFYCGASLESWGPETLHKGMGGSEEAIVYLSRELAKLGWQVAVYNDREKPLEQDGVFWLPYHLFNPADEFDAIVAWRNPKFFTQLDIKARVKGVDMHDTPFGHQAVSEQNTKDVDKWFLKSHYQWEMASHIPKKNCVIASNGIVKEQFDVRDQNPASRRATRLAK